LSDVVWSQVATHRPYGGVVPELASRKHVEKIVPVVEQALVDAGIDFSDLDGIAVTAGPGLVGSLLVGVSYAKALAYVWRLPLVGVNHLEGHVAAVFLEDDSPPFPFVALLVSGGHTNLEYVSGPTGFETLGQTRDDAAGEAYDKVAKLLGLGYPGGAVIDHIAAKGDPCRVDFPRALMEDGNFDFSFSGIKTAVKRYVEREREKPGFDLSDTVAGFQEAVVDVLVQKAIRATQEKRCDRLAVVGGVASNSRLRQKMREAGKNTGIDIHIPRASYCTDNGAMIAAMGCRMLRDSDGDIFGLDAFSKSPRVQSHLPHRGAHATQPG
jgi:N6-L-threonylcarbamoyladenine synthase